MPRAVIVTALGLELEAVLQHLTDRKEVEGPEGSQYVEGRLETDGSNWDVLVVETGAGNQHAAAETERAIGFYGPEVALFVGIAGGVKDVERGDVVFATKTYNVHAGKADDELQPRPTAAEPSYRLFQLARKIARNGSWLKRVQATSDGPDRKVVFGPIAAGEQVVVSEGAEISNVIREHYGDTVAVDMESAGFSRAAHMNSSVSFAVIRGISDLRDDKSPSDDELSQPTAASHAAAFAVELLSEIRVDDSTSNLVASNLPATPPAFVGRDEELGRLSEIAKSSHDGPSVVAITGLGGIGKTRLAMAFANQARESFPVTWVVSGADELSLIQGFASLAVELGLPEAEELELELAAQAALNWLSDSEGWLVVIDDLAERAALSSMRPQTGNGVVVVTSRNAAWKAASDEQLELGVLSRQDSIELLKLRTGEQSEEAADALAEALGDLPLALSQAGGYIEATGTDCAGYLERFRDTAMTLLGKAMPDDYKETVATTWKLALEALSEDSGVVAIIGTAAFCSHEVIPRDLFDSSSIDGSPFDVEDPQLALDEAISRLLAFSLVTASDGRSVEMHRLVQTVIRERMAEDFKENVVRVAEVILEKLFPPDPELSASWDLSDALVPHAFALAGYAEAMEIADGHTATMLYPVARYLAVRYDLEQAEKLLRTAYRLAEEANGRSVATARAASELGGVLAKQARFDEAQSAMEEALATLTDLAPENTEDLRSLRTNLGSLYRRQGRVDEAVELLTKTVAEIEAELGPKECRLVAPLVNLANALDDSDRVSESIAVFERALELSEECFGDDSPKTAIVLSNLGARLRGAGRASEDLEMQKRAVKILEDEYGDDFPDLAPILVNLAKAQMSVDELEDARETLQRSYALESAAVGVGHPDLASTLINLANVKAHTGDADGALADLRHASSLFEDAQSFSSRDAIQAMMQEANLLVDLAGDLELADGVARHALEIAQEEFGNEHSVTASAKQTLGKVCRARAHKFDSAKIATESAQLQSEAVEINVAVYGEESSEVADTLSNLGNILGDLGMFDEALEKLTRAEAIAAKVYGTDNIEYASILLNLGLTHIQVGNETKGNDLAGRALEISPSLAE